jgi:uncharacterized membrane protein
MRENKVQYYKNDYNERGFDRNKKSRPDSRFVKRKPQSILPPPSILRAYEEISEGASDRLIEMAEIEQIHRHDWENMALTAYARSHRLGQICGMLVALAIIYASIYAVKVLHDQYLATMIAGCGFSSIIVSTFFAAKTKRYESRVRKYTHNKEERKQEATEDTSDKEE